MLIWRNRVEIHRASWVALAIAAVLLATSCAAPVTQMQITPETSRSPRALLRSMTDYLADQSSLSFQAKTNFEIYDRGQKLQYAGAAGVQIRRPDGLVLDYHDDLSARRVWYDGQQMTLFDPRDKIYASAQAPPTLDDALNDFEERYGLVMPLSDLIGEDAYALIASRARSASYVGLHDVDGDACHHLLFVGAEADLQLWIGAGERPVPCKLVVDYKHEPGRPQYVAVLGDWEFGQELAESYFQPSIPDGARKIEFLEIEEVQR